MSQDTTIKTIAQRLKESYVIFYASLLACVLFFLTNSFFTFWFGQGLLYGFNPIFIFIHAVFIGSLIAICTNFDLREHYCLKSALRQVTAVECICFLILNAFRVCLLLESFPVLVLLTCIVAIFWVSFHYFKQSHIELNTDQRLLVTCFIGTMALLFGYGCQVMMGITIGFGLSPVTLALTVMVGWILLNSLGMSKFSLEQQLAVGLMLFVTTSTLVAIVEFSLPLICLFVFPATCYYAYTTWHSNIINKTTQRFTQEQSLGSNILASQLKGKALVTPLEKGASEQDATRTSTHVKKSLIKSVSR